VPQQASATGHTVVLVYVAHFAQRPEVESTAGKLASTVDRAVLRSALVDAEVDWARCQVESRHGRVVVLVPPSEAPKDLVDVLPSRLAAAGPSGNADSDGMRLVIHVAGPGEDSSAIDYASRVADSLEKSARRTPAGLDVFVTDAAYRETILGASAVERAAYVQKTHSADAGDVDLWVRDPDIAAGVSSWVDALAAADPGVHRLLARCAFLGSGAVPLTWFAADDVPDAERLVVGLEAGVEREVVRIDRSSIRVHPVLRGALRDRMSAEEAAEAQRDACLSLAGQDPAAPTARAHWPRYRELVPHGWARAVLESGDPRVRALVVNLARYLYFTGDQRGAAALADRARHAWSSGRTTDPQVLDLDSIRGLAHWSLGKYAKAAKINKAALKARRRVSGKRAPETIVARLRVAVDVRTEGKFSRARKMNKAIHRLAAKHFPGDDPVTLQTAHDLAVVHRLCGDFRTALDLDTTTWQARSFALGGKSSDALNTLSGAYMDRRELGHHRMALDGHKKVAKLVAGLTGDDAPGTLLRRAYLAVALRRAGSYGKALDRSAETHGLLVELYGQQHPATLACAVGYATDLRNDGRLDESHAVGEQARREYRSLFTDDHPMTLAADANAAVTMRLRGDAEGARKLNKRTRTAFRKALRADHPHAIACAVNLASDLAASGDLKGAVRVGTTACGLAAKPRSRALGPMHPTTLAARLNLALDLDAQGADNEYADILDRLGAALGAEHPVVVGAQARTRVNLDVDPLPL
jgi:tetratricopeptide (TPR) repeat protein